MTLRIGELAPDFISNTTHGEISLHAWAAESWVLFFSHPADFTAVCTTELGKTAQMADKFATRNVKLLGLSTDTVDEHLQWIKDVNNTQKTKLEFPIAADTDLRVARLYEMIHPDESDTAAIRAVFIIDPKRSIRLTMTYPMNVGRSFTEMLRVIDALQLADANKIATPADWQPGDPVLIPSSISDDAARNLFPQGWEKVRPYLRITVVK
jgi:alkyl hydroperoxide reductase subunit AhpC